MGTVFVITYHKKYNRCKEEFARVEGIALTEVARDAIVAKKFPWDPSASGSIQWYSWEEVKTLDPAEM